MILAFLGTIFDTAKIRKIQILNEFETAKNNNNNFAMMILHLCHL